MIDVDQIQEAQDHIDKGEYSLAYWCLILSLPLDNSPSFSNDIKLYADTMAQIEPHLQNVISPREMMMRQEILDFTIARNVEGSD